MRVSIAKVLIGRPDVLLLDEPTNHLDIESILWLEQFLKTSDATILMTCHDRDFMNQVVGRVVEIDAGELVTYAGNYDFYDGERHMRAKQQDAAFAKQQAMLKKEERFIERFDKNASKASQVQSRVKKLEKIDQRRFEELRRSHDLRRLRLRDQARGAVVRDGRERRR